LDKSTIFFDGIDSKHVIGGS